MNIEKKEAPIKELETEVTADELNLCALLLNQVADHIRDGNFYTEWDYRKGWYFDTSDIDKNLGMIFRTMKILLTDNLKRMNEDNNDGKTIVNDLFDYVPNIDSKTNKASFGDGF
jgi:hypothetical protein